MFNFRKKQNEETKKDLRKELSEFAGQTKKQDKFLTELMADNKFVSDEMQMRSTVESVLKEEFSEEIKDLKSYDILVDAVMHKLKKNQIGYYEEK